MAKNGQKAEKTTKNGFLAKEWPNGHLAFLAFREGYTFSDKIAPTDWPSLCLGILDSQTDTVGRYKMMLGTQNNIPGLSQLLQHLLRLRLEEGGDQLSRKQLLPPPKSAPQDVLATYGIARQRTSAHSACRKFVTRKRYEGIRLAGRCSDAAPRLLRGCSNPRLEKR